MARGEWNDRLPTRVGPLAVVAAAALTLLGLGAAVLRPWHRDRSLLYGRDDLVIRIRGNALGSRCELASASRGVTVPWRCGANAFLADDGGREVVRIVDVDERTCAVELATLRTIGCVGRGSGFLEVTPTDVVLETYRVAWPRSDRIRARFDRATGAPLGAVAVGPY